MAEADEPDSLPATFARMRAASRAHPYPPLAERRELLSSLIGALVDRKHEIAKAISADFGGRSTEETLQAEILTSITFLKHARRNLARWMRPERRGLEVKYLFGSNRVVHQPLGVVGILAPWNYPVALSIGPLAASLSAGNRTILRLSGRVPPSAETLRALIAKALPEEFVRMYLASEIGGEAMTALPFDHLVFTGSTEIGRDVMRAAAKHLTPVTLELGGKSPAIVHPSYLPAKAARAILWGKLLNAGQTCIAPDYALIHAPALPAFVDAAKNAVRALYPDALQNPDYTSLVDDDAFRKIAALVEDARAKGASVHRLADAPAGDRKSVV